MKKLTFLLPLKDRAEYTEVWLKHNLRPEYDYLVADGSLGDGNELLFRELDQPNLKYVRFPPDQSIEQFIEKMCQATERVQTKYVMTCDNDDFIDFNGVADCISVLDGDLEAVCAGGGIYGVMAGGVGVAPRYTLPMKISDARNLHNLTGFDALVALFRNYRYLWYSIFRTESYGQIWREVRQLQITNVYLLEIFQAALALSYGKYLQVRRCHYVRLLNPYTSCAKESASDDVPHLQKIYFDDDYRKQAVKMMEHIAGLLGVEKGRLLEEFAKYYFLRGGHIQNSSQCSKIYDRLTKLHIIIPRKLHIYFSIGTGMALIDFLGRIRSITNGDGSLCKVGRR